MADPENTQHATHNLALERSEGTQHWQWYLLDDNPNEWEWGNRARRRHDLRAWMPVHMPISVQEALWRARRIPHPYRDLNSHAAEWVEHRDWVYGTDFVLPPPESGRRLFLEFEGVTDRCRVFLNSTRLLDHEGPGAPFTVEIGPHLREDSNQLLVLVHAPPREDPQTGWTDRTRSLQGRMGYGWDFAPRLVRLGILSDVRLRETGAHRLYDLWARPALADSLDHAQVALEVQVDGPPGATVRFTITRGQQVAATAEATASTEGIARATVDLPTPQLWWPNGLGGQPLYTATAECLDGSDKIATNFGVRRLRWVQRPDAPQDEWPFILQVNGRQVFQNGWNWVPADAMGGPRADRLARRLLRQARAAGVNMLRCWGGADPETPAFYDTCDRLGILVWQEFPLSSAGISNVPPSDPAYLDRLEAYARPVVAARRNHPSLTVWGGGNELQEADSRPLTLAHPYAARLDAVVRAVDPDRMFRPSSPLGPHFDADPEKSPLWDVHGAWEYSERQPGPQYWRVNAIRPLLHSEFGLPGIASRATQERYLSPRFRTRDETSRAWRHHGGAWWKHGATLDKVFGPIADEELAILASQWLQAEGLRYYVEETRRRWPHSAGIFPWQLNEPWPNVVCTSAVEYGGQPKLAYYAVRAAYRPTIAAAHYPGFTVPSGEPLRVEIWVLNAGAELSADVTATLQDLAGNELHPPVSYHTLVPDNASASLGELTLPLPEDFIGIMVLDLVMPEGSNRYLFSNAPAPPLHDLLNHPQVLRAMFAEAEHKTNGAAQGSTV